MKNQQKPYEGKGFTKKVMPHFLKFKDPTKQNKQFYKIDKSKITIETHKKFF